MLAYVDPNMIGLPLQTMAPWLAAVGGAALTAVLMGWRTIMLFVHWAWSLLWQWRRPVMLSGIILIAGFGAYTVTRSDAFRASGGVEGGEPGNAALAGDAKGKDLGMPNPVNKDILVVVLGMDGLDPDLLDALMATGELPAFETFKRKGDYGRLATTIPPESPVVWSSFATGRDPSGHEIFDFIHRHPRNYHLDLSLNEPKSSGGGYVNPRQGTPFWGRLAQAGVAVEVLFAPCSFPPTSESGHVLAGMGTPDLRGNLGQYTLVSSDPTWAERDLGGRLVGVARRRGPVRFSLPGPRVGGGDLTLSAEIHPSGDDDTAVLTIAGDDYSLTVGRWSPWVRLTFKRTFRAPLHAICRFHLNSLSPDLNLYVTPMQFDPAQPVFAISEPEDFSNELTRRLGRPFATLGMPIDTKAYEDGALDAEAFQEMAGDIVEERRQLLMAGLDEHMSGLVFCYFGAPDPIQHMFWQDFLKQRLPDQGISAIPEPIRAAYKKMDDVLAQVQERLADRPDARLIVVSDHGFADFRRAVAVNRVLMELGYLHLTADKPGNGSTTGRPLFRDIDWSRTQAYACGFSSVFVNEKDREGKGIVSSAQKTRLIEKIRRDLLAFTDSKTGEQPIAEVYLASKTYDGAPTRHQPDLVLGMRSGYRASWVTALGGVAAQAVSDNDRKWRGGHIIQASEVPGIVLAGGAAGELPEHIRDVGDFVLRQFQQAPASETVAKVR